MQRNMSFTTWLLHVVRMLENRKLSVMAKDYEDINLHAIYKLRVSPKKFVSVITERGA